jgi:hypothetical protein
MPLASDPAVGSGLCSRDFTEPGHKPVQRRDAGFGSTCDR